ncbi:hypothetical protein ACTJIJ_19775 [Niabella sp. 22666]|uniref:hypothetical protein n=1 Tax=Niabella sp. 22666 TaxID=3453954 RepID=UPI003F844FC8
MPDIELIKQKLTRKIECYKELLSSAVANELLELSAYYRGQISGLEAALNLFSEA